MVEFEDPVDVVKQSAPCNKWGREPYNDFMTTSWGVNNKAIQGYNIWVPRNSQGAVDFVPKHESVTIVDVILEHHVLRLARRRFVGDMVYLKANPLNLGKLAAADLRYWWEVRRQRIEGNLSPVGVVRCGGGKQFAMIRNSDVNHVRWDVINKLLEHLKDETLVLIFRRGNRDGASLVKVGDGVVVTMHRIATLYYRLKAKVQIAIFVLRVIKVTHNEKGRWMGMVGGEDSNASTK